jgi:D-glycero-D-manno-heptose 1,7-bisphosphate phosphatase
MKSRPEAASVEPVVRRFGLVKRPALFLDRDGVINHDPGDYTKHVDEFTLLPTFLAAMQAAAATGYAVVVITNQGGIAKGLYTHDDVRAIHAELQARCTAQGTPLTGILYSPHHPDTGESLSRKPGSLLIERALARYGLDAAQSWMIGDKDRDLEAAAGAGVRGIKISENGDVLAAVRALPTRLPC